MKLKDYISDILVDCSLKGLKGKIDFEVYVEVYQYRESPSYELKEEIIIDVKPSENSHKIKFSIDI